MYRSLKIIFLVWLLVGCNIPVPHLFSGGSGAVKRLSLPSVDRGYVHLKTRVITTDKEYAAFLSAIDTERSWEHKVAFGIKIAKESIDFRKQNLMIYRHPMSSNPKKLIAKAIRVDEANATVHLAESNESISSAAAQAFFYKVSKKLNKVIFKSKQNVVTVKNVQDTSVVPKECIAWFDGCNHCIRANTGKRMCTKRYCKKKDVFRCVKWQ